MSSRLLLLSVYPLSRDYLVALRKKMDCDFNQITLAELRQHSGMRMFLALRQIRPDMILLPLEDENSFTLAPILKLLAAFTSAKKIGLVQPNLDLKPVSRLSVTLDVFKFGIASISCLVIAARSWIELRCLLGKPRIKARTGEKKGRVLYLKTNLWFGIKAGGSVGHIAGVVNALNRLGCPVTFASAESPVMVDPGVEIHKVAPPETFGLPYELNNYRFQRNFALKMEQRLAQPGFSMIYQRLSAANYLGVVLSRAFRLPFIVEYNGSEVWVAKHWGKAMRFHALATLAEEVMLRHAHLIVTISEVLRDELITNGVESKRIVCYPNCIDPEVFCPERFSRLERKTLRARYDIPSDATLVAFIGTFGHWHGAEILAEAITRLYDQEPEWLEQHKVHFMLVGDGLKMPQVSATIESADANGICTFAGLVPQEQAALHLAAADILVSPHVPNSDGTRFFGSPTKLFEYMAMEKGIIASNLDQIGEVLSPGLDASALPPGDPEGNSSYLAVLCKPGDIEDLIRSLKFMVERRDWCSHLGRNARLRALEKYTWNHHVQAFLNGMN